MKRFALCLFLFILLLPLYAQKKAYGSFFYEWNDCEATISGYGEINPGFYKTGGLSRHCLEKVIIKDGITAIGDYAFSSVEELKSVIFPNSIKRIGYRAFWDSGITSIAIPNSVVSIEDEAFARCSSLMMEQLPNSLKIIGKDAFAYCNSICELHIPDGVTTIGDYAFLWCEGLITITIPNSVTSIGNGAFQGCKAVSSVVIPIPFLEKGESEWRRIGLPVDVVRSYKKGLRDENGNPLIFSDDIKLNGGYTSVTELIDGNTKYYKVSKNGRRGLTDSNGREIIPCEMEALESAGTGYLRYKLNGFWGLMNYQGKILIDTDRGYTSIGDYKSFNKRFAYTMTGYKGECDATGRQISKIKVETPQPTTVSPSPSSTNSTNTGTQTIVVEHKHDPVPMQVWKQCGVCYGSGTCQSCANIIWPAGSDRKCFGCGWSRKCQFCAGQGGHYEVEYR